ncbi:MAG: hypothetical protein AAB425_12385 [Bdellovibrionota bacterium]
MYKSNFWIVCVSVASFLVGTAAQAATGPWCSESYRFSSYGRGLSAGFSGSPTSSVRPRLLDEGCYSIGLTVATEAIKENGNAQCRASFKAGFEEGMGATSWAGNECFSLGYDAGLAFLEVSAREGSVAIVGKECVDAFKKGYRAAAHYEVPVVSMDPVVGHCYMTGYQDGEILR